MVSENKALKFNFSKTENEKTRLYFYDKKGLSFLWSNFASCSCFRQKVENFHLFFFFFNLNSSFFLKYFPLYYSTQTWLSSNNKFIEYLKSYLKNCTLVIAQFRVQSQSAFTCSKLTLEKLEQSVKSVQR